LDLRSYTPSKKITSQGNSWDDTFTEEYAKQNKASPKKVKEDMEGFFDEAKKEAKQGKPAKAKESEEEGKPEAEAESPAEPSEITEEDVEEAAKGSDQVIKEYQDAQKDEIDAVTPTFGPVASAVPPLIYRDQPFITKMNTSLREWKVGRKEVAGETGSRLSIPQYVHHKEEPFVTRIRKSAKGRKILVVADFSQSMEPQEDDYKKALISSMEVLDGIGAKTALYGFGGEKGGASEFFFKVKRFEDPKWKPDHSAKTAALTATMGYTPTDRTYGALAGYIKKHRPDVTVTITDGSPNGNPNAVENTKQLVKELKRHTRMVAFGIGENAASARQMEEDLRGFGYNRVFSVDNLHQIPPKLVNLIAPA